MHSISLSLCRCLLPCLAVLILSSSLLKIFGASTRSTSEQGFTLETSFGIGSHPTSCLHHIYIYIYIIILYIYIYESVVSRCEVNFAVVAISTSQHLDCIVPENRIWIQYIYISFSFGCREVWVNCVSLVYDLLSIRDFWRHWESHVINGASGIVCWRAELSSKALSVHTISSLVILVAVFCLVTLNQANHISI